MSAKHFCAFVVTILLFCMVLPESSGATCKLNEITSADIFGSGCNFPKGYKTWFSGCVPGVQGSVAAFCKANVTNCIITTIQLGSNVTGFTLNDSNLSSEDIIVIISDDNKRMLILSKTGLCLNMDGDVDFSGNNIFQNCHTCLGSENANSFNLSCVSQSQLPLKIIPSYTPDQHSDQNGIVLSYDTDFMRSPSSYEEQMGSHSTASIISENITGVLIKLQNATDIKVGITMSGDTKVITGNDVGTDLYCLVDIPAEVNSMAVNKTATICAVVLFTNTSQIQPNSFFFDNKIMAIEMGVEINNLSQPITLQYNNVDKKGNIASCVSWNGSGNVNIIFDYFRIDLNELCESTWTTDGCYLNERNNSITCECTHLTFFALLMSAPPTNISASDFKALTYITSVGCGLSMFFLAAALFMHCLIRKEKASQATKILMNLFVAMLVLDLSFLVNESIANLGDLGACVAIAAVMHYTMLATFSWFFVKALHIHFSMWRSLSEVKHYMIKIGITGWGTPAVVVIVLLALQKYGYLVITINDESSSKMCWISDAVIHNWVNIGYYAVVFIFTFGVFITAVHQVVLFKPVTGKAQHSVSGKSKTFSVLALLFLLGITWAFAFFSYGPLLIPSYYIFTILNSFQGFFLFIYYYNTSKIVVDDRSLKAKESTDATSNTAVTIYH